MYANRQVENTKDSLVFPTTIPPVTAPFSLRVLYTNVESTENAT